jgi:septal ring factor EnvC (AmiA/AmiB activator)
MNFTKKVIGVLSYTTLLVTVMVFVQESHVSEHHQESMAEMQSEMIELKKEIEYNTHKCELLRQGVNYLSDQIHETRKEINRLHKVTGSDNIPHLKTISN